MKAKIKDDGKKAGEPSKWCNYMEKKALPKEAFAAVGKEICHKTQRVVFL